MLSTCSLPSSRLLRAGMLASCAHCWLLVLTFEAVELELLQPLQLAGCGCHLLQHTCLLQTRKFQLQRLQGGPAGDAADVAQLARSQPQAHRPELRAAGRPGRRVQVIAHHLVHLQLLQLCWEQEAHMLRRRLATPHRAAQRQLLQGGQALQQQSTYGHIHHGQAEAPQGASTG